MSNCRILYDGANPSDHVPVQIQLDVVPQHTGESGKTNKNDENIENEEPHLVQDLNATGLLTSRWENSNGMNISRENVVQTYFELLTDDEIKKLYEIYKPDFLLFEYQFELRGLKYNVPKYQHKVEQEALHQEPASSFGSNIFAQHCLVATSLFCVWFLKMYKWY